MDTRKTWPTESTGLTETHKRSLHGCVPGPLHMFCQLDGCSSGVSNSGRRCVNDSFACCWNSSLSFGLPFSASKGGLYLTFCILFYPVGCCLLETCSFLRETETGRWADLGRGAEWVGEAMFELYCRREESILNKKRQKKKNSVKVIYISKLFN